MRSALAVVTLLVLSVVLAACGGGGGGGGGPAVTYFPVTLENVEFLDPAGQLESRPQQGPANSSLVQQILFEFSGAIQRGDLTDDTVLLRDLKDGTSVPRSVSVSRKSRALILTPLLPTRPAQRDGEEWDVGGASLFPDHEYEVGLLVGGPGSLSNLIGISGGLQARYEGTTRDRLLVRFRTTNDPQYFWTGLVDRAPRVESTFPADGAVDISPNLFSDPQGRTSRDSLFEIECNAPLDPHYENIRSIRLLDLLDSSGHDTGAELPATVSLLSNEVRRSVVRIEPRGILPLGHELGLLVPWTLRSLGGKRRDEPGDEIVARFRIWNSESAVEDAVIGIFETDDLEEESPSERSVDALYALWDVDRSDRLVGARAFPGEGEHGRFIPSPGSEEREIVLRTDRQELPLLDGSTPDVPFTVVEGGVFNFTRIFIPEGVIVRGVGPNPLVLTATQDVEITGRIEVSGRKGETEGIVFDQGLSPLSGGAGGPGGARGGDGHPLVLFDGVTPVSPRRGAAGESVLAQLSGGRGGESAVVANPPAMDCATGADGNGSRGGAGGGGVFLLATDKTKGIGTNGKGDTTSDERLDTLGNQVFIPLEDGVPNGGTAGDPVFADTIADNDFIGLKGEYRSSFGGQGGGGGGSRLDSYHCAAFAGGLPVTVMDARGGGGGGGGGVLEIRCLGNIMLHYTATNRSYPRVSAVGGNGGYGEQPTISDRGGAGGGGAGGLLRFIALGELLLLDDLPAESRFEAIHVEGGKGGGLFGYEGGAGGPGLVQVELPPEVEFTVPPSFVRPERSLVAPEKTPTELIPLSLGQSRWIYLGRGVFRDDGRGPRFTFTGTDENGYVPTDANGLVVGADAADFTVVTLAVVDPLTGEVVEPERSDYLPDNAWVRIEFQAALPLPSDPDVVDPTTLTPWSGSIAVADGHPFLRFRVTINIAREDRGYQVGPGLRIPAIQAMRLRFEF
ncbi:MAG: hypothetical protein AB1486_16370 [Planctomycetota bacterium]